MIEHRQNAVFEFTQRQNFNAPPKEITPIFQFDNALDTSFLNNYYQEDLHGASLMFEVFLNFTVPNFQQMLTEARYDNWEEVKHLAHKMKPSFDIVGLTHIATELLSIERDYFSTTELPNVIAALEQDFQRDLPDVVTQKIAIDNFLQVSGN